MTILGSSVNICYFVHSIYGCDIEGCNKETIIMNINMSKGRRCIDHAPDAWLCIARTNLEIMFDLYHPSETQIFHISLY